MEEEMRHPTTAISAVVYHVCRINVRIFEIVNPNVPRMKRIRSMMTPLMIARTTGRLFSRLNMGYISAKDDLNINISFSFICPISNPMLLIGRFLSLVHGF